jgi:membrane-bound lytic murein transglycosylase A
VIRAAALLVFALLALVACIRRPPPAPHLTLAAATYADLRGWSDDAVAAVLPALVKSCAALAKLADDVPLGPNGIAGTAADWRAPCDAAAALNAPSDAAARRFFETAFTPFLAGNNDKHDGLFTGYFEPELRGARQPGGAFTVPLLRRPPDLVMVELGQFRPVWRGERIAGRVVDGRLRPYVDRVAIEHGALDRMHLDFLWVDDPVDAFFLGVQGSGRVRLPDGSQVRIGYDGQNGWPYVAIGRLLAERGAMAKEDVSLASIRAWIAAHPAEGKALMDENPSYVFFRELRGDGPIGAEGVVLTPGRSLAVDAAFLPLGVPLWLDIAQEERALRRLVVAQDTGGAIRGPVRGDLFWGFGAEAETEAGKMRARGVYYLLLPKRLAARQTVATSR